MDNLQGDFSLGMVGGLKKLARKWLAQSVYGNMDELIYQVPKRCPSKVVVNKKVGNPKKKGCPTWKPGRFSLKGPMPSGD